MAAYTLKVRRFKPEEGQGPSQEIALRAGADVLAMVLVPGPDGNELQLRRYGAALGLSPVEPA